MKKTTLFNLQTLSVICGILIIFTQILSAQNLDLRKRSALVIGNNDYKFAPLENPVRDARLIGETLRDIKFQVTVRENLKFAEMKTAIADFSSKLPKDGVALFYFGGHGIQINGRSFIIPTDFSPTKKSEKSGEAKTTMLDETAISVDELVATIKSRSGLNIVILDACRNGQGLFSLSEKTEEGLAAIKAPAGTLIAYSTSPGETAADGDGDNSLYAAYLAENLRMKPSRIEDVFKRTRLQMVNYTGEAQVPWENSSLVSDFYFTPDELAPNIFIKQKSEVFKTTVKLVPQLPFEIKALQIAKIITPFLNESGARASTENSSVRFYKETTFPIEMIEIVGSQFQMGTGADEADFAFADARRYNDELTRETITAEMPRHLVNVPGFFMSKTEITQAQWQSVMGNLPNIEPQLRGANFPVVNVSWREVQDFCEKLSQLTGKTYRLPTEAEWEFAARAGTNTPFAFGNTINTGIVNYMGSAPFGKTPRSENRQKPVTVGGLNTANSFGLFDMHGNVWEWTQDVWHPDYDNAPTDGTAWTETDNEDDEPYRVIRGGSWDSIANSCRSAYRRKQPAARSYKSNKVGFRVVAN